MKNNLQLKSIPSSYIYMTFLLHKISEQQVLLKKFCWRLTYIWIWFSFERDIIKILDFVAIKEVFSWFSSYGRVGCSGNRWGCCGSGGPPCGSWRRVWCPRNRGWCSGLGPSCWSCYWHAWGRSWLIWNEAIRTIMLKVRFLLICN